MASLGHSCDRCRKPIEINRTLIHVQSGPISQQHPAIDLCVMCVGDLLAWLKAPAEPDLVEETLEQPSRPADLPKRVSFQMTP
jgi:hypothetical protein